MDRLVAVSGIHLVGFLVATFQVASRADSIPERSVVDRGVFRGVGQNQGIDVPTRFERFSDRTDAAVHHVRWRNDISTCFCVAHCLLYQGFLGDVIEHITVVINDAVLPVRGVRIQSNVSDNPKLWQRGFQCFYCALNQPIGRISFSSIQRFLGFSHDGE